MAARIHRLLSAAALALLALPARATAPQAVAPAELQADLRFALDTIEHRHPELAHSVKVATLEVAAAKVRQELNHPMDQAHAWATLAQLNPVLADGHLFIGLPDWRNQGAEAIHQGIGFFPFEIAINAGGYPAIVAALGGTATPLAGRRIMRINGQDARHVARSLLARMHGDTPAFRRALLAQRWWLIYSKLYGTPVAYDLVLEGARQPMRVMAGHALPAILQRDASFDRLFGCRVEAHGSAWMTVASFVWEDKARFFQFTHDCFAQIKAARSDRLIIDVSENGGGDDDMWKGGILHYVATKAYKQGSTYVERKASGAIAAGTVETPTLPAADEPLHFAGKMTVVIGPLTYSSAVLFANVVRDYGFGTLEGVGGAARTQQSGGVQSVTLPHTGLVLFYPRFVLDPPAGTIAPAYLDATTTAMARPAALPLPR